MNTHAIIFIIFFTPIINATAPKNSRDPFSWNKKKQPVAAAPAQPIKKNKISAHTVTQASTPAPVKKNLNWTLSGISMNNKKPCALFHDTITDKTKVIHQNEYLDASWKVERIAVNVVQIKNRNGMSKELTV
jgi:hypothetical protein